ncbi:S8 family serine peptidase [Eubacterium sp. 1001713B170207_170306_E7]|uniref:S8 family serine peptidase n=1 Tax=Eubacterium sp. 1001713B170207_170306_E7 TaxID=2787097 RepID=UPI00189B59F9|nr:S8 family serine peptidase [Eubacterium sp. 1001713B170207_170306_E7]
MKKLISCLLTALLLLGAMPPVSAQGQAPADYAEGEAIVCLKPESLRRDMASPLLSDMDLLMDLNTTPKAENADSRDYQASAAGAAIALVRSETLSTNALIDALESSGTVLYAEPNYSFSVSEAPAATAIEEYLDMTPYQWAYKNTGTLGGAAGMDMGIEGWNETPEASGAETVVAVLDTGIDYTHPDLAASMWTRPAGMDIGGGTYGYNAAGTNTAGDPYDETDPMDDMSHGTHCAGIIAAGWNGHGTSGASAKTRLMAVKSGNDAGAFSSASILKGFGYIQSACRAGVKVAAVNNSWGGQYSGIALNEAITALGELGVVSVFASGNETTNCDENSTTVWGLKSNPYVIAVNALDNRGKMAYFSNYGARSTDIAAPGVNILSTYPMSMARYKTRLADDNALYNGFEVQETPSFHFEPLYPDQTTEVVRDSYARDGVSSLRLGTTTVAVGDKTLDVAGIKSEPEDLSGLGQKPAYLSVPAFTDIPAGHSPDAVILAVSASVQSTTGEFVPLYNAAQPDQPLAQDMAGLWTDNTFILPENTDWANFTIQVEVNVLDMASPENPVTLPALVYLDAIGAGSQSVPYADSSGTSMAAPAVTGEVALLAARYPEDSAAKRAARVIGSAEPSTNLSGTSVSGGYASLKNTASPAPVLNRALPGESENELVIDGYFFGSQPGTVTIENTPVTAEDILEWRDTLLRIRLPQGFAGGEKAVTVTQAHAAGGLSGHQVFELFDSGLFYENSLPLPDVKDQHDFYTMTGQSLTALNGKLYYLGVTSDSQQNLVWRYDLQSKTWEKLSTQNSGAFILSDSTCTWNGKLVTTALRSDNNHFCLALYTPETNRWELFEHDALNPLLSPVIACSGDTLVLAGGMDFSSLTDTLPASTVSALRSPAAQSPEALIQRVNETIGGTSVDAAGIDFDKLFTRNIYSIRPDKGQFKKTGTLESGRAFGKAAYSEDGTVYLTGGFTWDKTAQNMVTNTTLEALNNGAATVLRQDIMPPAGTDKPVYTAGTVKDGVLLAGAQGKVDQKLYDTWKLSFSGTQGFIPAPKRMAGDLVLELAGTAYNGQFYVLGSSPTTQNEMIFRSTAVETIPQAGENPIPTDNPAPDSPTPEAPAPSNAGTGILSSQGPAAACAILLALLLSAALIQKKRAR